MRTAFSRISDMTGRQGGAALADAFCVASRIEAAEPVAVFGIGYRFPDGAVGPQRYWDFLVNGAKCGGFPPDVADFDADFSDSPWARRRAESRTDRML
jgi:phthiocerol/phenolphthiocerol synthesis type-I polyketide synthase D